MINCIIYYMQTNILEFPIIVCIGKSRKKQISGRLILFSMEYLCVVNLQIIRGNLFETCSTHLRNLLAGGKIITVAKLSPSFKFNLRLSQLSFQFPPPTHPIHPPHTPPGQRVIYLETNFEIFGKLENTIQGRQPPWETTSVEDDLS